MIVWDSLVLGQSVNGGVVDHVRSENTVYWSTCFGDEWEGKGFFANVKSGRVIIRIKTHRSCSKTQILKTLFMNTWHYMTLIKLIPTDTTAKVIALDLHSFED